MADPVIIVTPCHGSSEPVEYLESAEKSLWLDSAEPCVPPVPNFNQSLGLYGTLRYIAVHSQYVV